MFLARKMGMTDAFSSMATLPPYPPLQRRLRLVALRPDLYSAIIDDGYHKVHHIHLINASTVIFLTTFITPFDIGIEHGRFRPIPGITSDIANYIPIDSNAHLLLSPAGVIQ
jgi:hypothetical protein